MMYYTPLHNNAYEFIKKGILSGKFQPGKLYSETKLAREIGLSRTPVRVALQQLQRNKFLTIVPNKGFKIYEMAFEDVVETYQIRAAIEGYAAAQLARDNSDKSKKTIKKLDDLYLKQKKVLKDPFDLERFIQIDHDFHETLVTYIKNPSLTELFFNQMYKIHAICINTFHVPSRPSLALQEHERIIKALHSGHREAVHEAVMAHLENIISSMEKIIKK